MNAGDLLFTINDQNYRAEVAAAEASVASATAQVSSAQAKFDRYEALAGTNNVSQADLTTAQVELAQAEATLQTANAQLQLKQITLDQTRVTTPIDGTVGAVTAEIGSLVMAGQADSLTTVRTTDPVYVELVESSANIVSLRTSGTGPTEGEAAPTLPTVRLTLEDGSLYAGEGTVSSAELVVSESTGTVTMRATVSNADKVLLPGMFVRAHLTIGEQADVFLVPQRAVTFNSRSEPTAYFVGADNKVEQRLLTASRDMNNAWVVTKGVAAGDKLIVDGLQKISDGTAVNPLLVTISEDGVVYQDMSTSAASAAAVPEGMPALPEGQTPPSGMGELPSGAPPADMSAPPAGAPSALPSSGEAGN